MDRRRFLARSTQAGAALALAGCAGSNAERQSGAEPEPATSELNPSTTSPASEGAAGQGAAGLSAELPDRESAPLKVLIDTDAANEIDDQFAIAYALRAPDALDVVAMTAAPFAYAGYLRTLLAAQTERGEDPATPMESVAAGLGSEEIEKGLAADPPSSGMEKSLIELGRMVDVAAPTVRPAVLPGATSFMSSAEAPVESEAAEAIIGFAHSDERTLYVPVLGAATNVASALLLDPTIGKKMVVIFVAGYPSATPHVDESFNLVQDLHASRVLFERCPQLLYIPGYQVAETLTVSLPELDSFASGTALGDELVSLYSNHAFDGGPPTPGHRWVMWDMAPIAWLVDPSWVPTAPVNRATIASTHLWEPFAGQMTEAYRVDDRGVFTDFFKRLAS